jgi:small subunit ribosomal protein S5
MPAPRSNNANPSQGRNSGGDRRRGGNDRRGDRGGRGGPRREPSEFAEATLSLDRVTRVVKGGRRMRFRAVVVVGNRKGKVGLGTGKATEVQAAIRKASSAAKRHMMKIPLTNGTIPHQVDTKFKAARIRLLPARDGTGIIAGGALRVILDHAGVKNVLSKRYGSRNKLVNAQATMQALELLRQGTETPVEEVPAGEEADKSAVQVVEMSKKDVEAQKEIHRKNAITE